jgi:hypothetical protein
MLSLKPAQPDYRRKRASKVSGGNRRVKGSQFASTGGADRPRLSTTLPLEALEQLDALALAHELQRNEVLTLALAAIAHPTHGLPAARDRFSALAAAWEGFSTGVQPPAATKRTSSTRPGKLGADAKARIRQLLALGSEAPRGWMTALAKELGCTVSAVSRAASKLHEPAR